MTAMTEQKFTVTGMTCAHCVASVSEEVGEVAGVARVDVDLASGRLAVLGTDVDPVAVRAAVAEAGYEVAAS
jgi:copper chaperone CopZ